MITADNYIFISANRIYRCNTIIIFIIILWLICFISLLLIRFAGKRARNNVHPSLCGAINVRTKWNRDNSYKIYMANNNKVDGRYPHEESIFYFCFSSFNWTPSEAKCDQSERSYFDFAIFFYSLINAAIKRSLVRPRIYQHDVSMTSQTLFSILYLNDYNFLNRHKQQK